MSNLHVDYEVTIPSRFNLDSHTDGGNLIIDGLQAALTPRTGGGSITLADSTGDMNVTTGGGNVVFGRIQGNVNARTGGGSITIKSVSGSADAQTVVDRSILEKRGVRSRCIRAGEVLLRI